MSRKTALLLVVSVLAFAADQGSKYLAVAHLTTALHGREGLERLEGFVSEQNLDNDPNDSPGRPLRALYEVKVLRNYWSFRYVENPGAAWGTFAGLADPVRVPFFIGTTVLALGFILWMFRRVSEEHRVMQVALALVLGGAVGNFTDRALHGYVIDFIDWHWRNQPGLHWPTFNVADAAISVGVVLLVLDSLRALRRGQLQRRAEVPPAAGEQAPVALGGADAGADGAPVQGEATRL